MLIVDKISVVAKWRMKMSAMELLAMVSFATLMVFWAILPSSKHSEKAAEKIAALALTSLQ